MATFPNTTQVTGTTTSEITEPVTTLKHHCPNHSKKEVEYYCQTCNLGLCSKCIYRYHNTHETLDLECDSTREIVVEELSKSEQFIQKKIKDLEKTQATLLETSDKFKSFCDEACTKISEKTEKIIGELRENCEKIHKEIRDHFDKNESQLTETRQKFMTQMKNIKTDLDTSRPTTTEEPSLILIYSLNKLQDLQKLCVNMTTDIPPVTLVEWSEGSVKVCDILGSTESKTLYQSNEARPYTFNYKDIKSKDENYYCKDRYTSHGVVWCCRVERNSYSRCLYIYIDLLQDDNPRIDHFEIEYMYTVALINKDKDKNVISETRIREFVPWWKVRDIEIRIPWNKVTDPSEGFIDNKGQFLVRLDELKVLDIKNEHEQS